MMKYSTYLKKDKIAARLRVLLEQVICALSANLEARQKSRRVAGRFRNRHHTDTPPGDKGEGEMGREPGESDFRDGSSVF